jgi:cyanophycinase
MRFSRGARLGLAAALLSLGCAASASTGTRGTLLIVGGGSAPPELPSRFVALAGGPGKARIAVIPMASEEAQASGDEKKAQLDSLGADAFVFLIDRSEALDTATVRRLAGATGIWFCGGDQIRLTRILLDSPVLAEIKRLYHEGAVLGGTSAGAAIMSDSMLTGNQYGPDSLGYYGDEYDGIRRHFIEVVPGLGFLSGAIVDQHFIRRERENRLLSVILERPSLVGIGIDEGTALEVGPTGPWRIIGASAAVVIDARHGTITDAAQPLLGVTGLRVELLPAGSSYDLRSGRATLPASR